MRRSDSGSVIEGSTQARRDKALPFPACGELKLTQCMNSVVSLDKSLYTTSNHYVSRKTRKHRKRVFQY